VLILIVSFSTGSFLSKANLLNLLRANSVNAIICCGMLMAVLMGEIDISVGSTVGLSGVIAAYLITDAGFPVWLTLLCCLLVGLAIGAVNGVSVAYFRIPAFVATLGMMSIGRGLTALVCGGISIRVRNDLFSRITSANIGGLSMIIIYALVICLFTWVLLNRTRFGYYIYAIGGNRVASRYSGVNTRLYNLIPYLLIGMFSAFGGIIWTSRLGSAAATLGQAFEMDAIAGVVIGGASMSGGVGTVGGMVIGVLIIGVITNGLNLMGINPFWQEVFKGIIILTAVIVDVLRKGKTDGK
jgi:ribose transport system permease protein